MVSWASGVDKEAEPNSGLTSMVGIPAMASSRVTLEGYNRRWMQKSYRLFRAAELGWCVGKKFCWVAASTRPPSPVSTLCSRRITSRALADFFP